MEYTYLHKHDLLGSPFTFHNGDCDEDDNDRNIVI